MQSSGEPLISIITPSFNQGEFIERTILSILDQTYKNYELIIVDGASTDNTLGIIKKYEDKITWLSEEDNGQSDAINKGIRMAKGGIITYLNTDDLFFPNTLEIVASYFRDNPDAMWLSGDAVIIDENDNEIQSFVSGYKKLLRLKPGFNMLSFVNFIIQPGTFLKKEIFEEFGGFDQNYHYAMDYDYWLKIIQKYKLHFIRKPLSKFRIHSGSKGGGEFIPQLDEAYQIVKKYNKNPLILFLHRLSSTMIKIIYRLIK